MFFSIIKRRFLYGIACNSCNDMKRILKTSRPLSFYNTLINNKASRQRHINNICYKRSVCTSSNLLQHEDSVSIFFVDRNGTKIQVEADIGDNLLDIAKDNDIDGVEGACGGTLACSTCHCIFKQADFDRLALSDIPEEELDMLDLAYGLTDTSRLVCSIDVTKYMDGLEITVPIATNDARD